MSILILGGSGFIGKNLLKSISDSESISLRDEKWKEQVLKGDVLINLVGKAHDHKEKSSEADFYFVNVELTKQVFEAFVLSKARLLIHISSIAAIEEFDSPTSINEEAEANPYSYYGRSKRDAEKWLLAQVLPQGKKLIILRPPMVHGKGDKGSLGLLYKLISKGIPYPLSSFDNKRSFISIDNFCFFINEIVKQEGNLLSGVYHIADDESISTNDIIEIIKKVENKTVHNWKIPKFIVRCVAKIGDILPFPLNTKRLKKMTGNLVVSNQRIKKDLGIDKLPLTAKEGLEITISSFKYMTYK